ncbi:hypothetical protein VCV18_009896 [Metarhizium anisopliae]
MPMDDGSQTGHVDGFYQDKMIQFRKVYRPESTVNITAYNSTHLLVYASSQDPGTLNPWHVLE